MSDKAIRFNLVETGGRILTGPWKDLGFLARVSWVSYLLLVAVIAAASTALVFYMIPLFETLPEKPSEDQVVEFILQTMNFDEVTYYVWVGTLSAFTTLIMIPPTVAWARLRLTGERVRGIGYFKFGKDGARVIGFNAIYLGLYIAGAYVMISMAIDAGLYPNFADLMALDFNDMMALSRSYPYADPMTYLFMLVAVWVYGRWSTAIAFIIKEPDSKFGMARSWRLTRGSSLKILGLLFFIMVLIYFIFFAGIVFGGIAGVLLYGLVSLFSSTLGGMEIPLGIAASSLGFVIINVMAYGYIIGLAGSIPAEIYLELKKDEDKLA